MSKVNNKYQITLTEIDKKGKKHSISQSVTKNQFSAEFNYLRVGKIGLEELLKSLNSKRANIMLWIVKNTVLSSSAKEWNICYVSQSKLARLTHSSRKTVYNALKAFKKANLLKIKTNEIIISPEFFMKGYDNDYKRILMNYINDTDTNSK